MLGRVERGNRCTSLVNIAGHRNTYPSFSLGFTGELLCQSLRRELRIPQVSPTCLSYAYHAVQKNEHRRHVLAKQRYACEYPCIPFAGVDSPEFSDADHTPSAPPLSPFAYLQPLIPHTSVPLSWMTSHRIVTTKDESRMSRVSDGME